jgi:group I intron endonuclease
MVCGVYRLETRPGRFYIGSSRCIEKRCAGHVQSLRRGCHYNAKLQRSFDKNGGAVCSVVLVCDAKELLFYEQLAIDQLKPPLNVMTQAGGGAQPPEICRKISDSLLGNTRTLGKKHSKATKVAMSQARKGKPIHTDEYKAALREKMQGNTFTRGKRYSGKKLSAAHKLAISRSLLGNTRTKGRKLSKQHLLKLREGYAAWRSLFQE